MDEREQVLDPLTAYQMVSIMEGVVQRGTGVRIKEKINKPLAGKTGTTNEAKDLWFLGFSPELAVGVYIGFDKPRSLGSSAQASQYAAPIFADFMAAALKDKPATPFHVPPGMKLVRVNVGSGQRAGSGESSGTILEAFKPGTAPPENQSVVRLNRVSHGRGSKASSAERALGPGAAGIY
jgi:penicillin-binding protein 1A